jgi:tetratricopeptide (TPR) repeat protein
LQSLQRALHVVRVNDGLYSERQLPIVREMLDIYRSSGDLQALDARYDYFFRLYGNGEPPFNEVRLRATLEYLRWQREAARLKVGRDPGRRLLATYELNADILEQLTQSPPPGVDVIWQERLVTSQLRNLYLLVTEEPPPGLTVDGVAVPDPVFQSSQQSGDLQQQRLWRLQQSLGARVRSLLQPDADSDSKLPPELLARRQIALGDWYQWQGRSGQALDYYLQALESLRLAGLAELAQQWLSSPLELPVNGAFWQPRNPAQPEERRVILPAQFDVNERGRAENIQTGPAAEGDERFAARLKRELSRLRFRPRIVEGEPRVARGVSRSYEVRLTPP